MTLPDECQVLVVGSGPAGASAAMAASKLGAQVFLVDAKPRIGERPHCGEYVPRRLFVETDLDRACIIQPVDRMETLVIDLDRRSGSVLSHTDMPAPGYLIDRVRFDRDLARSAAAEGTTVLSSTRLIRGDEISWTLRIQGREQTLRAAFVIAADGPLSTVAALVGMEQCATLNGLQVEVPLCRQLDNTFVFLARDLVGGYGWLFPKDKVANVGVGVLCSPGVHPGPALDRLLGWLRDNGMIRSGVLARYAGLIPVSGMRRHIVDGGVVLCGDAAGLTHPITGAGIPQALLSGHAAGRAVALALKSSDSTFLQEYASEMEGRYRKILEHALAKRSLMISSWNDPDFVATCERFWIGFKGYRKRVRA